MLNIYSLLCADENASRASWIVKSFPVIKVVIMCMLAILSIMMIVLVVMQKSSNNGSAAITGQTDTFYSRNKKSTLQGKIKVMTIVVAVIMMVLCLTFMIMSQIFEGTLA